LQAFIFYRRHTIKGKAVILAGGSGGLGAAVAETLAERGAIPVIGYLRNRERAESLAKRLSDKYGIGVPAVPGDILDASVRQRLIDQAERAGELYGLVPLVGNPARVPIETATEQDLIDSMKTNFIGPVLLARDFAASAGDRDAAIVFISTMQGTSAFPGSTSYAAPKAALVHTARILAKQWRIRVNIVAPGVNNAGMAEQSVRSGKYDPFLEKQIIPRFGRPADVARAILFFLEPDNYVTGQVLTVDGGLSLKM
jgi:NAD(P)-dependent dehydrogenase (short-subunit alcohol dehydrogenase family)